ncbi:MAG TPA: Ig-like domain-containing protein [Patescibacteria group bacterium]|jgi:hypothetical protein|nr:Ig-like domain-containing protein [Patescibacteria group bacterium]
MHIQQSKVTLTRRIATVLTPVFAFVGLASAALSVGALAPGDTVSYSSVPFNASEWSVDRATPSGGYSVGSFGGRDNALNIGVDVTNRSTLGSFYYTEGLKKDLTGSTAVKADLYVDSAWNTIPTRAGLWGVGSDGTNVSAYPIVEYTTNNADMSGYTGWRTFNDETGVWTEVSAPVHTDGWNTVAVEYNSSTTNFDYVINGTDVGSNAATGSNSLSAVILNQYNYGPTTGSNYDVHWSNLYSGRVADDGVAPDVALTNPLDGSTVSGTVDVRGTVTDANPDHYYLKISGPSGTVYSHTYAETASITNQSLYSWNTAGLADGEYTIRLEARDAAGNKDAGSVTQISVTVNNSSPYMKDQCKDGNWKSYSMDFKNQGACVSYVNHHDGVGSDDTKARGRH